MTSHTSCGEQAMLRSGTSLGVLVLLRGLSAVGSGAALGAALLAGNVAQAQVAKSADAEHRFIFNIPSGPLPSVLARFAAQTGISLSFDAAKVAGLRSNGVQGSFTLEAGLAKVLENTGFDGVAKTDHGIALVPSTARTQRPQPPLPATIAALQAAAAAASGASIGELPKMTVVGPAVRQDWGSTATSIRSATRTDTPIAEIPQSIQLVTQDALKGQQVQSVGEALRLVSGITFADSSGADPGGTATLRGLTAPVLANGVLLLANASAGMTVPTAAIERIEVLKGADSIIGGAMKPGGAINLVMKRPQADPVRELTVQVGSYGNLLGSIDVGNAIVADKSLSYRLVVSGEQNDTDFQGYKGGRSVYIAPSIAWHSDSTKLVLGLEKNTSGFPYPASTVLTSQGPLQSNVPLGNADDRLTVSNTAAYYEFEQSFGEPFTFRSVARYDGGRLGNFGYQYQSYDVTGLDGGYIGENRWTNRTGVTLDNNFQAKLNWGSVGHTLLAGASYARTHSTNLFGDAPFIEGAAPPPPGLLPGLDSEAPRTFQRTQYNYTNTVYFQDQITWNQWHVLLSMSHGKAWTAAANSSTRNGAWSPVVGLLYQLTPTFGIYANANRSFTPNTATLYPDVPAPPSTGRSQEIGVKLSLLDEQLTGTVSVFRSREFDTLTSDPAHNGFSALVPSSSNRGLELDINGRLMPGWLTMLSYTYRDYQNDAANSASFLVDANGKPVLLSDARPKNTVSLWTEYTLQGERLRGWGAGAGLRARSGYHITDVAGNDSRLAGQAQTDLSLYYRAKQWSATAGVKNVFNRRLYGDSSDSEYIEVLTPRRFTLTVATAF